MARHAIVVGGGIGGLSAAVGLRRKGAGVTVLERASTPAEAGTGLVLQANGLRALEIIGVADEVRSRGLIDAPGGARTPSGRWLARVDGKAMRGLLGVAAVGIHRAELHRILRAAATEYGAELVDGAEVVDVTGSATVTYRMNKGAQLRLGGDLVIGADGLWSLTRRRLWPQAASPVYSGSMAWRAVTPAAWEGPLVTAITWGRGAEFGMVPLIDGRVYWYGAITAPGGGEGNADLRRCFGGWHDPIPALLAATPPDLVRRDDLYCLDTPLDTYVRGEVALLGDAGHPMMPNLGQGANQALEDAAVLCLAPDPAAYDRLRRPRSQAIARASRMAARFGQQLRNPAAVATRNMLMRLTPPSLALRGMTRYSTWTPPG